LATEKEKTRVSNCEHLAQQDTVIMAQQEDLTAASKFNSLWVEMLPELLCCQQHLLDS
jgi:hypothetical protein